MTEEKIYEFWEDFKKQHRISTSQQVENYIDGKSNFLNIVGNIYIYSYPSVLVKELDGENSELARRILYVISKIGSRGMLMNDYAVNTCRRIGYSFQEVLNSIKVLNPRELMSEYYYTDISTKLVNEYESDCERVCNKWQIFIQSIASDKPNFTIAMYILLALLKKDRDKYKNCVKLIKDNIHKIGEKFAVHIICQIYDFDDDLTKIFKEFLNKKYNIAQMERQLSKDIKEVLFSLGEQEVYYEYKLSANMYLPNVEDLKIMEELYDNDKKLFIKIYNNLLGKQGDFSGYMLIKMLKNNDDFGDRESHIKKMVSKLINQLIGSIKGENKIAPAEFMKLLLSDDLKEASAGFSTETKYYGMGRFMGFCELSLFYEFNDNAKKVIKLMFSNYYYHNKNFDNIYIAVNDFCYIRNYCLDIPVIDSLNLILSEILPIGSIFKAYCGGASHWYVRNKVVSKPLVEKIAQENIEVAGDFFNEIKDVTSTSTWLELYYGLDGEKNFKYLIDALKGKSKILRKKSFEIAEEFESELRPELEKILPKLKGDANLNVSQLLKRWNNINKFGKNFEFSSPEFVEEFCQANISNVAVRKISWIDEKCFENIRYSDLSGVASPNVIKYIISEYMVLDEPTRLNLCDKVAECLNKFDLQSTLEDIFTLWLDDGADTKRKFITLPYCIYASDTQIIKLKRQLEVWAKASRGALASFVVGNMALNGGNIALLTVDSISNKFPNNMVKNAAYDAFKRASEVLEVPIDELSDRIVPNLEFNKNGERVFDYGERTFTVSLMPDFSLSIFDNAKNKSIKSMPKPNDKDDAVKAENAKKEFSELKKQIKTVVTTQKNRLEKVLMNGRLWTVEKWRNLFEENAIMHCFAENLVWGTYEDGKLKDTFRYLSDGSFCNEEDDEYELTENSQITLVHPIELSEEVLAKWIEQFEDYEIVQPFIQLHTPIMKLQDSDVENNIISKYTDKSCTYGTVSGLVKKYNMQRGGEVGDGGSFGGYCLEDCNLGVGLMICFDNVYFGYDYNAEVKVEKIYFFNSNENSEVPINPNEISSRFVSSCLAIIDNMLDR